MASLKCCGCKERFEKVGMIKLPGGNFHSIECATQYSQVVTKRSRDRQIAKTKRDDKKSHTQAKKRLNDNDRSFQLKKTQQIFNRYIRIRDRDRGCISCCEPFRDKFDAGHYRSVGANPELRFNELNNHGQCVRCNQHLSANLISYRIGLVGRIGADKVDWVEGFHELKRYTIDDLKIIQDEYKTKTKKLEDDLL